MPHELILNGLLQPPLVRATLHHVGKLTSEDHPDSRYMRGTFHAFNARTFTIETGEWEAGAYPVNTVYRFEPIIIIPQTGEGEVFMSEKLEAEDFNKSFLKSIATFILECLIELVAREKELIDNDMRAEESRVTREQTALFGRP